MSNKKSRIDVLNYSLEGVDRGTVRSHYDEYLAEKGLPKRCEIPVCQFHEGPLTWNGQPLTLILDHIDGCNTNNSPDNLRYLCPNCNQQQPTHGGETKAEFSTRLAMDTQSRSGARIDGRSASSLQRGGISRASRAAIKLHHPKPFRTAILKGKNLKCGEGGVTKLHPRSRRLIFGEACRIA